MICKKCGAKIDEDNYCPICGYNELVNENDRFEVDNTDSNKENLWSKFANAGYIIGLVTFICSFVVPILIPIVAPIAGIVFSSLGRKSIFNNSKARKGLGFSISALIISLSLTFIISATLNIIIINYVK